MATTLGSTVTTVTNSTGQHTVPQDSHPNALDAVARSQLRLMLNLDITDILMDIMDTPMPMVLDMDMLSLDTATLMSAASWEKGQLRLMPNLDTTDILMDLDITDTPIIMDTVLSDPELLDMLAVVPLLSPEAPKVLANKDDAIHSIT